MCRSTVPWPNHVDSLPVPTFDLLGPLTVTVDGLVCWPTSRNVRGLLAMLLTCPGEYVSADRLCQGLWDHPPDSALANLRSHLSRLRDHLGRHRTLLATRRGGRCGASYTLQIPRHAIDLFRFRSLSRDRRSLREAVRMWRGPFGDDLPHSSVMTGLSTKVNSEWQMSVLQLVELELRTGNPARALEELTPFLIRHPSHSVGRELLTRAKAAADRMGVGGSTTERVDALLTRHLP